MIKDQSVYIGYSPNDDFEVKSLSNSQGIFYCQISDEENGHTVSDLNGVAVKEGELVSCYNPNNFDVFLNYDGTISVRFIKDYIYNQNGEVVDETDAFIDESGDLIIKYIENQ